MSDYELAYIFSETAGNMSDLYMDFATLLIAFLVGSFVVAHLLNRILIVTLLGIYSVSMFLVALPLVGTLRTFSGLALEIRARADGEVGKFDWHGITRVPDFILSGATVAMLLLMAVSFSASLVFFFERRKRGTGLTIGPHATPD